MELKRILESLIFISGKPLSLNEMLEVFMAHPDAAKPDKEALEKALEDLAHEWNEKDSALTLMRVSQGYEFRTKSDFASWIHLLNKDKPQRLSTSALEVLAIIAYRQPMTRAEIDDVRGVDSGGVLKNLLERRMIRLVGRKEEPGRPMLYGTSKDFLDIFGLKDLNELPPLRDFEEMVRRQTEEARVFQSTAVVLDDLLASTEEILAMEEGEKELLAELDDGMKNLKSVEKAILQPQEVTETEGA
ncbi:MAG: SMC-Scp complex subunit ScpB [Deltaproteobacteria bacterium]|nr:MAG: SMC-Scp complex subunit ScpB [Deltaproteobacteria bacterium]